MANHSVTRLAGCLAGHATHPGGRTGVTTLLFPNGAVAGHTVPGQSPGSRELAALGPTHITPLIHGICFAGGSVFGLSAADGVVQFLNEEGVGLETGHARVPIVPAAILYDLDTTDQHPDASLGRAAAEAAGTAPLAEGRVGAGAGARVGRLTGNPAPGGVGTWAVDAEGWTVAAVAVVNAVGGIRDPESGEWIAGELSDASPGFASLPLGADRTHTTLAAVITDAPLSRSEAMILARMATAAIARTHVPAHSPFDGDIVFAVSTRNNPTQALHDPNSLTALGHAGSLALERSIVRAVRAGSVR